ncbi:MAG: hypothetical protein QXJ38_03725 [Thermofilaceae archaeon]
MNVDQLVKLLGPARVVAVQRMSDFVLLIPPGQQVAVRVSRERYTRLSTELAWIFTAVTDCDAGFESSVIIEQKGFLRKRWSFRFLTEENAQLRVALETLLSKEFEQLMRSAMPERIAVDVRGGAVRVQVVKTLTVPIAFPLVNCYDLSWRLATTLSKMMNKK